jgi:hypothetical protein
VYQQQQPRWWKRVLWLGGILVALVIVLVLIRIGYAPSWTSFTGFGQHKVKQDVQPTKTLWDWLDLLIVPIVLAIGGYLFTRSENRSTQAAAERRAQDDALQAYLDNMSEMLIPNTDQPSLYDESPPDSLRTVARARTLTVLPRLAGDGKGRIVQFLRESNLIPRVVRDEQGEVVKEKIVDLSGANLREANLLGLDLGGVGLDWAILERANLRAASLPDADLGGTRLLGADLRNADLSRTKLSRADLSGADLREANLREANLNRAYLVVATGLTDEQITAATTLEGATMPNDQQYEDWLKDKKAQGKDEKNE